MGLCVADALLAKGGEYDGAGLRTWFHNWSAPSDSLFKHPC